MLKVPYVTSYLTEHFADDAFATLDGYEQPRRLPGRAQGAQRDDSRQPSSSW